MSTRRPKLNLAPKNLVNLSESQGWQHRGNCAKEGIDPEIFFLPYNCRLEEKRLRIAEAKAICVGCPVISECLNQALEVEEPFGVWGGLSEEERAVLLRRKKQAERKAVVS